jgi:hypothetical protein
VDLASELSGIEIIRVARNSIFEIVGLLLQFGLAAYEESLVVLKSSSAKRKELEAKKIGFLFDDRRGSQRRWRNDGVDLFGWPTWRVEQRLTEQRCGRDGRGRAWHVGERLLFATPVGTEKSRKPAAKTIGRRLDGLGLR